MGGCPEEYRCCPDAVPLYLPDRIRRVLNRQIPLIFSGKQMLLIRRNLHGVIRAGIREHQQDALGSHRVLLILHQIIHHLQAQTIPVPPTGIILENSLALLILVRLQPLQNRVTAQRAECADPDRDAAALKTLCDDICL